MNLLKFIYYFNVFVYNSSNVIKEQVIDRCLNCLHGENANSGSKFMYCHHHEETVHKIGICEYYA